MTRHVPNFLSPCVQLGSFEELLHGVDSADVARLFVDAIEVVLNERKELHALHEVVDHPERLQNRYGLQRSVQTIMC
jgi:hypothetical protein